MRRNSIAGLVLALMLGTPVLAHAETPAQAPCLVIFGGSYQETANADVNNIWVMTNEAVVDDLMGILTERGYNVRKYFARSASANEAGINAIKSTIATGCSEVLQIENFLGNQTAEKPDGTFGFRAMALHFNKSKDDGKTRYTVVGDLEKQYEYPRTAESLQSVNMSDVAEQIATAIDLTPALISVKTAQPATAP